MRYVVPAINVGFVVGVAVQLVISVLCYVSVTRLAAAPEARKQRFEAIDGLEALLNQLLNAETATRGFLLTGRAENLQLYRQALPALDRTLAGLREALSQEPGQRTRFEELAAQVARHRALLAEAISQRHAGMASADLGPWVERGKAVMDDLRSRLAEMQAAERRGLERDEEAAAAEARRTILIAAVAGVLAAVLSAVALWLINREFRQRRRAKQALRELNEQLEQRVAERTAELERANRELEERNRENEAFVYSVSHDLRAPLVNLEGFGKELSLACDALRAALADEAVPERVRFRLLDLIDSGIGESLRFIHTAVRRLSAIIDALLRLSRAGRVEYQWQTVNMQALVGRVVDSLRMSAEARGAEVKLGELPPAWGDPTALEQVFANLRAVLQAAGTDLDRVVKTTVYLADMNDFSKVNEVYATYFPEHRPARSCVEVSRLPKDVGIEIEVIATID